MSQPNDSATKSNAITAVTATTATPIDDAPYDNLDNENQKETTIHAPTSIFLDGNSSNTYDNDNKKSKKAIAVCTAAGVFVLATLMAIFCPGNKSDDDKDDEPVLQPPTLVASTSVLDTNEKMDIDIIRFASSQGL